MNSPLCFSAHLQYVYLSPPTDQVRNSYQLCNNGTLRVMYANGMGISFHTEPHILAGSVSPTIGRRNITLPTDNGLNSIEWRLRKEQTKGKVTVFGRKLRVSCFVLFFLTSHRWSCLHLNIYHIFSRL